MSTRPLPPPAVLRDDPGPWSVVSSVFAQAGRPGKRRPPPPVGLMLSPPPETALELAGIDPSSPVAGVGTLRVVAAAGGPALCPDGTLVALGTPAGDDPVACLARAEDGAVVRAVAGARTLAPSPAEDGGVIGGDWGCAWMTPVEEVE